MKVQKEINSTEKNEKLAQIKEQITYYFSEELQYDESIIGSMKRKQIERSLINWATEGQ